MIDAPGGQHRWAALVARSAAGALAAGALVISGACGGDGGQRAQPGSGASPAPEGAGVAEVRAGDVVVTPGGELSLQQALDQAQPGSRIILRAGSYPSDVQTDRPGPVMILGDDGVVLSGDHNKRNGPRIVNDGYTIENVEVADTDEGLRVEGAKDVTIRRLNIHHVNNECVRFRYDSEVTLEDSLVHDCGLKGNAEGVYVGLAPEQQQKFGGNADATYTHIVRLKAYNASEGVDVKENARAVVEDSEVWQARDENSGAIDFRSDGNEAYRNVLHDNAGAGVRVGGDKRNTTDDSECDEIDCWGSGNILRGNTARDNRGAGYRMMFGPQDIDCTNTGSGNGGDLFAYASKVKWRVPGCG